MNKYHNQGLIKSRVEDLTSQSKRFQNCVRKVFLKTYEIAEYEVYIINEYTPPEEIERRRQALYYHQDLFEAMKWKYKKGTL